MAVSRALRRLLRIRDLEEEQCRLALETATGELHRLQGALQASIERGRGGRRLIEASAHSGELRDRLAGIEEIHTATRFVDALEPMIVTSEEKVAMRRQEYMEKRIERSQAETLIKESEARELIETNRRDQQYLDDWFSSQLYRRGIEAAASKPLEVPHPEKVEERSADPERS